MSRKMSDYIKREDAKRVLNNGLRYMRAFGVNRCLTMIDEVPSADVVEVVRCKDCKHNFTKSWNQGKRDNPICHFTDFRRPNEFYCGFGERADT